jgi:hypothetical protein
MLLEPNTPKHVEGDAFMDAEERARAVASVERWRSGVDGPGMILEDFARLHGLPTGRADDV